MDSIWYFLEIHGFHGTQGTHANYDPAVTVTIPDEIKLFLNRVLTYPPIWRKLSRLHLHIMFYKHVL